MGQELAPLAGRYRFRESRSLKGATPTWLCVDEHTDDVVIVAAVRASRMPHFNLLRGVDHQRLASVLDVLDDVADRDLPEEIRGKRLTVAVVAQYIEGETLLERLERGALHPRFGVECIAAVTSAVAAIHTAGAFHGAISPRNIVYKPSARGGKPVLAQFLSLASAAYCSPERIRGGGPSTEDDVWGLYATVYAALTRQPPFAGKTREQIVENIDGPGAQRLSDLFLDEDELQEVLDKGLVPDREKRQHNVHALDSALEGWLDARTAPRPEKSMLGLPDPITGQIVVPSIAPSQPPPSLLPGPMPYVPPLAVPGAPGVPGEARSPSTPPPRHPSDPPPRHPSDPPPRHPSDPPMRHPSNPPAAAPVHGAPSHPPAAAPAAGSGMMSTILIIIIGFLVAGLVAVIVAISGR